MEAIFGDKGLCDYHISQKFSLSPGAKVSFCHAKESYDKAGGPAIQDHVQKMGRKMWLLMLCPE